MAAIPGLLPGTRQLIEWRYYGRNCVVFRQNQPAAGLLLVHSGWLRLYFMVPGGKRVSLGVLGPGSILGIGEIVNGMPHAVTAETGEETEVEFLGADHLRNALKKRPELGIELLRVVARQDRSFLTQLVGGTRASADRRLWNLLLDLSKSSGYALTGVEVKLQVSIQDISDQIGCSRQWTSKLLADLEKKGRIKRTGGWIILRGNQGTKRQTRRNLAPVPLAASGP